VKNYLLYSFLITFLISLNVFTQNFHYVSKNGNNSNGNSWANAWNELDQIEWNNVQPGDFIFIDGGSDSMSYTSRITIGRGAGPAIRTESPFSDLKNPDITEKFISMESIVIILL